ncbi:MAG: hypothetical protein IPI24_04180 [Ignavibacteria bacterium]|nr:hypothetical protein [Ignavibacteria bacterium]
MRVMLAFCLFFSGLVILGSSVQAQHTKVLQLASKQKDVWMKVRTATWVFDSSLYSRGKVHVDLRVVVTNDSKKPIDVGPGSFLIRLNKNDRSIFLTAMGGSALTVKQATIKPKDSLLFEMSFVLPDTGTTVELKLTPLGSKSSVFLTFLDQTASPCRRLVDWAQYYLAATDLIQKFAEEGKRDYYDQGRDMLMTFVRKKNGGPCYDARKEEVDKLIESAMFLINLEDQKVYGVTRGRQDDVAPLKFFTSYSRSRARKIVEQDVDK